MKKINKILVIFFLVLFSNQSNSENHNQVSVELDRIKNDIIDLQKFVYKNESSSGSNLDSIKKKAFARQIIINRISSYEFIDPIRVNSSRSFDYVFGPYNFLVFEEMSVTGINKKQFSIRVSLDDEVISEYITLAGNE